MAYLLILFLCFSIPLHGNDLGIKGHTFEIKEENLVTVMQEKSRSLSIEEVIKKQQNLRPHFETVKNLKTTETYKKFNFDPTVCVYEDVLDHREAILIPKGKCVNPLDYTSLPAELLFFDGENEQQVNWAKMQSINSKWILVKGNPLDLAQKERREVFFDQQGMLTQKLSIKQIPAKVTQNHKCLQIEEIPLKEET